MGSKYRMNYNKNKLVNNLGQTIIKKNEYLWKKLFVIKTHLFIY